MQLAKILLPVDFSERTVGAAHYAKTLACRFQSELNLVHVHSPQDFFLAGAEAAVPVEWYEDRRKEMQCMLEGSYAEEFRGMRVKRSLLQGDVAKTLVDFAHAEQMGLIVMPTHGYGPFRRFILGSVTAKVLHDADCPVLTGVHLEQAPALVPLFFGRVICAVDFDAAGEKALRWAAEFAAEFQSSLTVVHALPELQAAGPGTYFDPGLPALLQDAAQERMDQLQKQADIHAESILAPGSVAHVVREAAVSKNAELVVIGRHHSPGLLGRLRANSYAIVRESPCPVISV